MKFQNALILALHHASLAHSVVNMSRNDTCKQAYSTTLIPRIDTHSHIYPDFYKEAAIAAGWIQGPDGMPYHPAWSVEAHLEFMNKNNIVKSILSCSSPGTFLIPNDVESAVDLTRRMNDFLSTLKRQYPDRFGFFASLPLPAIPESLAEINRVLDELDPDGFVFMSNAFGLYGGDPQLTQIYEKLNDKKAVILVHPTCPCPKNTPEDIIGTARLNYVAPLMDTNPAPILEFIFDSTRNVADLIMTGTASANSNTKWIIPHCGATLPSLLDRFVGFTTMLGFKNTSDRTVVSITSEEAISILQRQFWFDLAGTPMNNQIYNMRRLVGPEKFLYGSDVPFTPFIGAIELANQISSGLPNLFTIEEAEMIMHGNAEMLFGMSLKTPLGNQ